MIKRAIILIVLSILSAILGGCSVKASTDGREYIVEDLQRYERVEVYSVADNILLNTIEDKEILLRFANNTAFAEQLADIDADEYLDWQKENKKKLEGYEPLYSIVSYKTTAALHNDGTLEKISEITLYKDMDIVMERVSPDAIKNFEAPSDYLTAYYEISSEAMDFLISLAGDSIVNIIATNENSQPHKEG